MKKGLTLIELLVSMGLAAIVFAVVSSLLVTIFTSSSKNRRQEVFEQTKNDLARELSGAVKWADSVSYSGSRLNAGEITYELRDGRIWKGVDAMTPTTMVVTDFAISDLSATAGYASLEMVIKMEMSENSLIKDGLRLVVSQRKTSTQTN